MKSKVTTKQIQNDLKKMMEADIRAAFQDLGKVVESISNGSALHGLEIVSFAFAALLDVYANPNDLNPQGMCDDPRAFRLHFAEIIARGADVKQPVRRGEVRSTRRTPVEGEKP